MYSINFQNEYISAPNVPKPDKRLTIFGRSYNFTTMPSGMNGPRGQRNNVGRDMHIGNNGIDSHKPIKSNPRPGAEIMASASRDNPFYWVGKPKRY